MAIRREMILMNVGEKILSFKERLNHKYFADFARAANVPPAWLNEIKDKEEIKQISDMSYLINLCSYLGMTIDDFLRNDDVIKEEISEVIDVNSEDISVLLNNMIVLLRKEGTKMDNVIMNDKSKEICIDSLAVVKTLVKQHL